MKRYLFAIAMTSVLFAAGVVTLSAPPAPLNTTVRAGDGPGPFCPPICGNRIRRP